ncbi:MAG: ABC transporter substrate-binding protein [Alphaproteobacteria bacterium]|nr:ABC transporter substrate-binding protein [Alphaproteobacteria bacterium]
MKRVVLSLLALGLLASTASAQQHLRIGLAEDPDILDPTLARTFVGRIVFMGLCDKLVDIDKDLKLVPQLATEWSWSPDQKQVTFKLRPNAKFHDGEPIDAEAVRFSLDRHLNMQGSFRRSEINVVKTIEVVDPMTIKVGMDAPFSPLMAQFTDRAGMIVSPKAAKDAGPNFGAKPVCSGPYKFVERVQQDRIVLEKFKDHWNAANHHVDRVTYQPIVDGTVRLANLRSGQIDMLERLQATDVADVKKDSRLKFVSMVGLGYQGITLNVANTDRGKNSVFGKDKRVRQAFELSIDRDAINQVVFNGEFLPGNQWVPPNNPWYVKSVPIPKRDVSKAKELLKAAGIPNPSFTMMITPGNEAQQVAQVIQAMVKESGFDMKIQQIEFATSLQMSQKGEFEGFQIGWSGRVDPDGNFTAFVSCDGGQNDGRYCNKEVDGLLGQTRSTSNFEARAQAYEKIAKILADEMPRVYLYHPTWFWAMSPKVQGFVPVPDALIRLAGIKLN